jgi:hypothetical protein
LHDAVSCVTLKARPYRAPLNEEKRNMSPREAEDTGKMLRLERATVGLNAIAGVALAILVALVVDVRGSIATLNARVETAIRDVAVIQSQGLDAHIRDLEKRMATVEARQGGKP